MKSMLSSLCAAAMAFSVAVPANAAMIQAPVAAPPSNVVKVQGTDYSGGGGVYRPRAGPGRFYRGERRVFRDRAPRWRGERFARRGDFRYWRGHRGYRYHRPGYRRHGDWWFPAAAFLGGAIIGNVIAQQPRRVYRTSSAHVDWCYDRYRSYRDWDNTFQPYNGPRRQCISPYGP